MLINKSSLFNVHCSTFLTQQLTKNKSEVRNLYLTLSLRVYTFNRPNHQNVVHKQEIVPKRTYCVLISMLILPQMSLSHWLIMLFQRNSLALFHLKSLRTCLLLLPNPSFLKLYQTWLLPKSRKL